MHNRYNRKVSRLSIPGLVGDFLLMFHWSLGISWSLSLDTFSIADKLYHDTSVWILHTIGEVDCNFVWFTEYLFLIWKWMLIRNFQAITVLLSQYCFLPLFLSSLSLSLSFFICPPSLHPINTSTLQWLRKPVFFFVILYRVCWSQMRPVGEISLWSALSVWLSDLKH